MTSHESTADEIDNRYTRGIANFVASLRYEDIPPEVRHRAKLLILGGLGSSKALSDQPANRLAETVLNLEDLDDAATLARLLVPSS